MESEISVKIEPIPATYEEALGRLVEAKYDLEPTLVHHFGGMALRNAWQLWHAGTPLHDHFLTRFKLWHADDMSGLLLDEAFAVSKGVSFDRQAKIDHFHDHWRKAGLDPFTGKEKATSLFKRFSRFGRSKRVDN